MIHSFDFKSFYTCDTCYNTAYTIIFFADTQCFIHNEKKRSRFFNRNFYKL